MENEIRTGVWKKESKNGNIYFGGKTSIAGTEYYVTVFDNREKKTKETQPDFNIILKAVEPKTVVDLSDPDLPF